MQGCHLHFRCEKHTAEGHFDVSKVAVYRCAIKGCELPARAYWYRGDQFATLVTKMGSLYEMIC